MQFCLQKSTKKHFESIFFWYAFAVCFNIKNSLDLPATSVSSLIEFQKTCQKDVWEILRISQDFIQWFSAEMPEEHARIANPTPAADLLTSVERLTCYMIGNTSPPPPNPIPVADMLTSDSVERLTCYIIGHTCPLPPKPIPFEDKSLPECKCTSWNFPKSTTFAEK